jgi:acetylornithine deacetylase/succinyl-diaminopimelate desuccinylase-like protein
MLGHRGVMRVILKFTGKAHHASLAMAEQNPFFDLGVFLTRLRNYTLPEHPVVGKSGIAPTIIHGDSQSQNLTPNALELLLDWRFGSETQSDFERILAELTQGLSVRYKVFEFDQHGPKLPRLHGPEGVHVGGFAIEPNHPLVTVVQQAVEGVYPAAPKPGVWNFGTDGRYTFAKGIPTVGFGPGDPALAHTTEEVVSLKEIEKAIEVLLKVVRQPMPGA